jgi:hypothetical protein
MTKTIVYLKKSNKPDKKFMVKIDNKTIHFGAKGMSDFTIHKDYERMQRYTNRHKKRENWGKTGIKTAGFWSKWLLWNKPSFEGSKKDIATRFNVTFKKWPNNSKSIKKSTKKSRKPRKSIKKSVRKSRKPRKSIKKSVRKSKKPRKSIKKSVRKSRKSIK